MRGVSLGMAGPTRLYQFMASCLICLLTEHVARDMVHPRDVGVDELREIFG